MNIEKPTPIVVEYAVNRAKKHGMCFLLHVGRGDLKPFVNIPDWFKGHIAYVIFKGREYTIESIYADMGGS